MQPPAIKAAKAGICNRVLMPGRWHDASRRGSALVLTLPAMPAKLLTEFVGTFIFLCAIALSGHAGALAPLAIGMTLAAMVYMGGHVSGAHYNPAVSFGLLLRGVISPLTLALYWLTQLVAGSLAFAFGYLITGHGAGIHP